MLLTRRKAPTLSAVFIDCESEIKTLCYCRESVRVCGIWIRPGLESRLGFGLDFDLDLDVDLELCLISDLDVDPDSDPHLEQDPGSNLDSDLDQNSV